MSALKRIRGLSNLSVLVISSIQAPIDTLVKYLSEDNGRYQTTFSFVEINGFNSRERLSPELILSLKTLYL